MVYFQSGRDHKSQRRNMSLKTKLTATTKHFVTHTSIRGLPRIPRAEDNVLKTTWSVFTIVSFCLLLYFVCNLYFEYAAYTTSTQVVEIPPQNGDFPAVSICYDMPLFNHFESDKDPKAFQNMVASTLLHLGDTVSGKNNSAGEINAEDVRKLNSISYFIESNYDSLLKREIPDLEDIVKCVYTTNGKINNCKLNVYPNKDTGSHLTTDFFHCFTFTVPENDSNPSTSMMITLKFDVDPTLWKDRDSWFPQDLTTHLFGFGESVMLLLHDENEPPRIKSRGTRVMLDSLVQLTYKKMIRKYINTPKQLCHTQSHYSATRCKEEFENELMSRECGCINGWNAFLQQHANTSHLLFCRNLTSVWMNLGALKVRDECWERVRKVYQNEAELRCARACEEHSFDVDKMFAIPFEIRNSAENVKNVRGHLREAAKAQQIFDIMSGVGGETDKVQPTTVEKRSANDDLRELLGRSRRRTADGGQSSVGPGTQSHKTNTRSLLLQVERLPIDTDVMAEESLVFTKSRLLSQVGGMCSIFVGLTFTVIAEIAEIIYLTFFTKSVKVTLAKSSDGGDTEMGNPVNLQKVQLRVNHLENNRKRGSQPNSMTCTDDSNHYGTTYNKYNEDVNGTSL